MKTYAKRLVMLAMVLMAGSAFAFSGLNDPRGGGTERPMPEVMLDDQCLLDFQHYTYGSHSGNMVWPGRTGEYYMTGVCFSNSCTPGEELCGYCIDLDHILYRDPYCVEIHDAMVIPPFAEQFPALAYTMSWYAVSSELEDRIMQLAIWKLSSLQDCDSPDYGVPFYHINDGRGYPTLGDAPAYPYVNTVYNTDVGNNDPANERVRLALGAGDGLPKNVIMSGDQIHLAFGYATIHEGIATIPVTITVERGLHAGTVNNLSRSGIKLQCSVDNGMVSDTVVFTDGSGEAHLLISQPVGTILASRLVICSQGLWPRLIIPCDELDCDAPQRHVQQQSTGDLVRICREVIIPSDQFLAVELTSFTVAATDRGVELEWTTASEIDNDRFEISRDGDLVAIVATQGNGATPHHYGWRDDRVTADQTYVYALASVDVGGNRRELGSRTVTVNSLSSGVAQDYALYQNYPNPFNPETRIIFDLKESGFVTLRVFDLTGREVAVLVKESMDAGRHQVTFDGGRLPTGVYLYRLDVNGFRASQKMLLIK